MLWAWVLRYDSGDGRYPLRDSLQAWLFRHEIALFFIKLKVINLAARTLIKNADECRWPSADELTGRVLFTG